MTLPSDFFRSILDSVTEHIVIIDQDGLIRYVNAAWKSFGSANDCLMTDEWEGVNYLAACDASAAGGDPHGRRAAAGTRQVIGGESEAFYYEYPCHGPTEKRWFMMRVTPLRWAQGRCFIISHQNITERRLAEDAVRALSLEDALTGMANRRHLDEFLAAEWRRGSRLETSLSLLLLDVDHFKLFNDRYGHQAGDECLQRIGQTLVSFGKRPGDLSARYGGEEFALVLSNTDLRSAARMAEEVLEAIRGLAIAHESSITESVVTASVGVAAVCPSEGSSEQVLVAAADRALYAAKDTGRNRFALAGASSSRSRRPPLDARDETRRR